METETYIKTSHATGKAGEGERWQKQDVCGTRNLCDNTDVRTQEAIVHMEDNTVYSVYQGGGKSSCSVHEEVAPTTTTTTHQGEPVINQPHYIVRRITPIEGERLQGFADNWTRPCFTEDMITDELLDQFIEIHAHWAEINGKPDAKRKSREQVKKWLMTISSAECPDGPRYKCIGNSMSVNVMQWIGQRIEIADRSAHRDRGM